jgi:hypothetical protein
MDHGNDPAPYLSSVVLPVPACAHLPYRLGKGRNVTAAHYQATVMLAAIMEYR